MTEEQKQALRKHVVFHRPIDRISNNHERFFLNDGEIIEFTDREPHLANTKFTLNNNSRMSIWFSQLSQLFITQDLSMICLATILFINGTHQKISDFDSHTFGDAVQGRKFRVHKDGPFYILNPYSIILPNKNFSSDQECIDYIRDCVNNNKIEEIGDMLKTAYGYDLIEV